MLIFFMTTISLQIHNGDNVPTIVSSKPTFHPIPYEILAPKRTSEEVGGFFVGKWLAQKDQKWDGPMAVCLLLPYGRTVHELS